MARSRWHAPWTAEPRSLLKPRADSIPPAGVDYDRWLGPAPRRPFNSHRFHGTWRMFRDYGNGEIGDDGIHDIDMAVWGLGVDTLPRQITAQGGRMSLRGNDSDYPDNLNVTYEYPDGRLLVYENYPFAPYGLHGFDDGNVFYGTEGFMVFSRRGAFSVFLGRKSQARPDRGGRPPRQDRLSEHMANFLDAVRNRTSTRAAPRSRPEFRPGPPWRDRLPHARSPGLRLRGRTYPDCEEATLRLLGKVYREPYGLPDVL